MDWLFIALVGCFRLLILDNYPPGKKGPFPAGDKGKLG